MHVFTYNDYIKSIHHLRLNAVMRLAEEEAKYDIGTTQDKLVKIILKDKKEVAKLINDFTEPKKSIKENEITEYDNDFVKKRYTYKGPDLVYKLKERDIYFVIEHQSCIDKNIANRLINYCIDIIYEWSKNTAIGSKRMEYPVVVPIVIYSGQEKWVMPEKTKKTNNEELSYNRYIQDKENVDIRYNLIEINKISDNNLLKENSIFGYGMICEKANNQKELKEKIELILHSNPKKETINKFKQILKDILIDVIQESFKKEIIKKVKIKLEKGEDIDMSCLQDRLIEEFQKQIRKEIEETKKEIKQVKKDLEYAKKKIQEEYTRIVVNLILNNVSDKIIIDSIGTSKEEFEYIKMHIKEFQNV